MPIRPTLAVTLGALLVVLLAPVAAATRTPAVAGDSLEPVSLRAGGGNWIPGQRSRWVNCTLTVGGRIDAPIAGQQLDFEARAYGRSRFRSVGSAVTGEHGQASLRVSPRRTTEYRCRWAGGDGITAPTSPALLSDAAKVGVSTHLTSKARRSGHGRRVVMTGVATPRHPGTRVTLFVRGISWDAESRVIARGRLSNRGTYELSAPLSGGPWLVYVRVAKAPGNIAGPSASRYVE